MTLAVPRHCSRILLGCLFVVSLSLTPSCEEDPPTLPCPPGRVGALEGYLLAGGVPTVAEIGARCADGPSIGEVRFRTISDSTGWYRLEMPEGPYRIEADPCRCTTYPVRDTIHVWPRVRRFDILQGRVTVRLRFPVELAGNRVWVTLNDDRVSGFIGEDGAASFFFPLVAPGTYPIRIQLPGAYQSVYLPGTLDPDAALRIVVPVDHPIVYEDNLESCAIISGSLVGSWQGLEVGRPIVKAFAASDSSHIGTGNVDESGDFLLVVLQAQSVKLLSEITRIKRWFGGNDFETATAFELNPGDQLSDVSMSEGGIICTLEGAASPSELDARIIVRDEDGHTWSTGTFGSRAVICNLHAGLHYIRVDSWCSYRHPGWANQWYDGASTLAEATPVEVVEGQAVSITFHLTEGAKIDGLLLKADGTPAAWWTEAGLFDQDFEPTCSWKSVGETGSFEFTGLGDGDYYLAVRMDAVLNWWYPGTENPDSAQAFSIRDRVSVTGVTWRLPPEGRGARR